MTQKRILLSNVPSAEFNYPEEQSALPKTEDKELTTAAAQHDPPVHFSHGSLCLTRTHIPTTTQNDRPSPFAHSNPAPYMYLEALPASQTGGLYPFPKVRNWGSALAYELFEKRTDKLRSQRKTRNPSPSPTRRDETNRDRRLQPKPTSQKASVAKSPPAQCPLSATRQAAPDVPEREPKRKNFCVDRLTAWTQASPSAVRRRLCVPNSTS